MNQQYTKKQHYVPTFYLQGFTNSQGKLEVFNCQSGRAHKIGPKGTAYRDNYYEAGKLAPNAMEAQLGELENYLARWFAGFLRQFGERWTQARISTSARRREVEQLIDGPDRSFLLLQMLQQYNRTPYQRAQGVDFYSHMEVDEAQAIFLSILPIIASAQIMLRCVTLFDIGLLTTSPSQPFWTSDNPVIVTTQVGGDGFWAGKARLYYPLTPTLLLELKHPDLPGRLASVERAAPSRVQQLNKLQALNSAYVYSCAPFDIDLNALRRQYPRENAAYHLIERKSEAYPFDVGLRAAPGPPDDLDIPSMEALNIRRGVEILKLALFDRHRMNSIADLLDARREFLLARVFATGVASLVNAPPHARHGF